MVGVCQSTRLSKDFVKNIFASVDTNNDEKWSFDEAKAFLPKLESKLKKDISNEKLTEYFNKIDADKDGLIDKAEFKKALNEQMSKFMKNRHNSNGNADFNL